MIDSLFSCLRNITSGGYFDFPPALNALSYIFPFENQISILFAEPSLEGQIPWFKTHQLVLL